MSSRILTSLIVICTLSGCVYFNTFYNTKKLYNEAKKERENRQGDDPTTAELTKYDKAIEKASKILELHPNSKYVDDAVMILGECFYYKGDYIKAQRKFEELITYFTESDYFYQAKLWLAKTNIELEDYITAGFQLEELLNTDGVKREIVEESLFLLGEIQYEQDYVIEAEQTFDRVTGEAEEKSIRAKAYYKLGLCQLRLDYYHDAVESFRRARDDSPNRMFKFDAELHYARALKLARDYGQAKQVCQNLLENESYKDQHGLVKLEFADCLYSEGRDLNTKLRGADLNYLGKIEEALDEYKKITLEFKKTEAAAEAYFAIGRIYEENYGDYVQAKEYYEKVKQEYPKSEWVPLANQKANNLADLTRLVSVVRKSQDIQASQNGAAPLRTSELEMVLLEHRVDPEIRFLRRKKKQAQNTDSVDDQPKNGESNGKVEDVDLLIANKLQLAETFMFQFGQIDSAIAQYDEIIELFPNHPSTAKAIYSKAFIYENEYQDKDKTDSLLYLLVHRFPESYQAEEARRILGLPLKNNPKDVAYELYKTAEGELLSGGNPNQAIRQFQVIVDEYPNSPLASKSLYAIGWIYERTIGDNEKALEVYKAIVDRYPDTEYAKKVQKKISATVAPPQNEGEDAQVKKEGEVSNQNPSGGLDFAQAVNETGQKPNLQTKSRKPSQ